jgi:hypothetical protein
VRVYEGLAVFSREEFERRQSLTAHLVLPATKVPVTLGFGKDISDYVGHALLRVEGGLVLADVTIEMDHVVDHLHPSVSGTVCYRYGDNGPNPATLTIREVGLCWGNRAGLGCVSEQMSKKDRT